MKHYEYVAVHIGRFIGAKSESHRYVGFIPTNMNDYGKIKDINLVFEWDR